jgi:hypothetical protein
MAVERRSHTDLYIRFDARDIGYDSRKVTLEMQTEGEEIRRHQDSRGATGGQAGNSFGQVGRAPLKEGGLDQLESALPGHLTRDRAHSFIRRSYARSVRKDDDPRFQVLPCT